ncbi:MAG: hypothetical protein ACLFNI_10875 [Natronomonas sp.]
MTATMFLEAPMDGESAIECSHVKIFGNCVIASAGDGDREFVVPLSNVTGMSGVEIDRDIEEIEFSGGRATDVVTTLS